MTSTLTHAKDALLICAMQLIAFSFFFFLIEKLYIGKEVFVGGKCAAAAALARILNLQILAQLIAIGTTLHFSKNPGFLCLVIALSFALYYSAVRGALLSPSELFGFGTFGNRTPALLALIPSATAAVVAYRELQT